MAEAPGLPPDKFTPTNTETLSVDEFRQIGTIRGADLREGLAKGDPRVRRLLSATVQPG